MFWLYADLRIRTLRWILRGVRREVHLAAADERARADQMPGLQKAGAQDHFWIQFAYEIEASVRHRRQKSRLHRPETFGQRRIRAAVKSVVVNVNRFQLTVE